MALSRQDLLGIIILILVFVRLFRCKSTATATVDTIVGPCAPPRDPIGPCLPPLAPRLQWPFSNNIVNGTSSTVTQAQLQTILNGAADGTTVTLGANEIVLSGTPLTISSSITLVGLFSTSKLRQSTAGLPCIQVTNAAANVQLIRLSLVNLDDTSGSCCVQVDQPVGGTTVISQCAFQASTCAIRVTGQAAIDVSQSTFAPILASPSAPLDYVVFESGQGASTLADNVWSTKTNGVLPITRMAVRKAGTFSDFTLQILNNQSVGTIEFPWLGIYEVESESAVAPRSQNVQFRDNGLLYSQNGLMLFNDSATSLPNYNNLVVYETNSSFIRPVGNTTSTYLRSISFTDPNPNNDLSSISKPTVRVFNITTSSAPNANPNYLSTSSTSASSILLRDTTAFPAPDTTFFSLGLGGCQ